MNPLLVMQSGGWDSTSISSVWMDVSQGDWDWMRG